MDEASLQARIKIIIVEGVESSAAFCRKGRQLAACDLYAGKAVTTTCVVHMQAAWFEFSRRVAGALSIDIYIWIFWAMPERYKRWRGVKVTRTRRRTRTRGAYQRRVFSYRKIHGD